ncbi:hypothetical protein Y032_0177g610 [Ancylostoma ceylanicum]|uniref:Uncharacterized protein n=1 Tax=Ancylostoma ceylanicum TaxID=53326 RepID=A0A016SUG5_9BILA|nr:hypothetical protein Y032_0177g610 [Ancylostoma ceylanicum]
MAKLSFIALVITSLLPGGPAAHATPFCAKGHLDKTTIDNGILNPVNARREKLAQGTQKNGDSGTNLPPATNMPKLVHGIMVHSSDMIFSFLLVGETVISSYGMGFLNSPYKDGFKKRFTIREKRTSYCAHPCLRLFCLSTLYVARAGIGPSRSLTSSMLWRSTLSSEKKMLSSSNAFSKAWSCELEKDALNAISDKCADPANPVPPANGAGRANIFLTIAAGPARPSYLKYALSVFLAEVLPRAVTLSVYLFEKDCTH